MALRAKPPVAKPTRLRALIYATKGVGKTHLCTSIPNTYYIDTEGLEDYPKFVKILKKNNGEIIRLNEFSEIIDEVKELITIKHNYKTLVIDSVSFPYGFLANLEAERLSKKDLSKEGTEYGANLAKAKRLTFHLGMLLTRLDMNIIVTAHEKAKFQDGKEIGSAPDINEKMEYALGTVIRFKMFGKQRKAFVEKTRYENNELESGEIIDFPDDKGYEIFKDRFGEEVFSRETITETLADKEQIKEFNRLKDLLKISDEITDKWFIKFNSTEAAELNTSDIQKCIDKMKSQINKGE